MAYLVKRPFRDSEDELRLYGIGGRYPREGFEPTRNRIELLADEGFIAVPADADQQFVNYKDELVDDTNTVDEIKAYLDAEGVKYKSKATKPELLDLVADADEPADE